MYGIFKGVPKFYFQKSFDREETMRLLRISVHIFFDKNTYKSIKTFVHKNFTINNNIFNNNILVTINLGRDSSVDATQ